MANEFERDAIMNIQKYLRHLSFHGGSRRTVPTDGIWDSETREALREFQLANSLEPTGSVDRATWERLKAAYDESIAMNSPPAMLSLFPREPVGYEISRGDTGFLVDTVQYLLGELERLYYFPEYTPSGEYDAETEKIIRDFQRINGIAETGRVGRETWDALAVQHNLFLTRGE